MTENSSQSVTTEIAPDPSDDDLDDLDDVLDQFSSTSNIINKSSDNATTSRASGPGQSQKATAASPALPAAEKKDGATESHSAPDDNASDLDIDIDDAFAQNLEKGMEELLASADAPPELKAQLEGLLHALDEPGMEAQSYASSKGRERKAKEDKVGQPGSEAETAGSKSFQDKIQETMNRMQDSSDAATTATSSDPAATDPEALLTQLLHQMEAAGLGNDTNASKNSTSSDPNADPSSSSSPAADPLNSMLMNMMSELTHKEILYEPMKELHDKFPEWIARHKVVKGDAGEDSKAGVATAVSEEDMQRYEQQQRVVADIVERFERPSYSDDSVEDREFVVERMQTMQAAGSPPPDLVGDIGATQEALTDLESGCPQQ